MCYADEGSAPIFSGESLINNENLHKLEMPSLMGINPKIAPLVVAGSRCGAGGIEKWWAQ